MDFKSHVEHLNPLSKAVPGKFIGPAGIVNSTVYKTETIFTICLPAQYFDVLLYTFLSPLLWEQTVL